MSNSNYILVSPAPVDGYPPVQYQAKLLAEAGNSVTLLTTGLTLNERTPAFAHPGVTVRSISSQGSRSARMLRFAYALLTARRALPRDVIEIAYDPLGLLFSDFVPLCPRRRVAHLHELLQSTDQFLEGRLKRSIHRYDVVVVPDAARAQVTQEQLRLAAPPLVVENYPLRADVPLAEKKASCSRFEVVYCGSLGMHQKLDQVIRSMPCWPSMADLVLIGNDRTATASKLRAIVREMGLKNRVGFLGWMDTDAAERRVAAADIGIALLDRDFEQWRTALGASNKRYQYMKAGLPQIGDKNPGVPELLDGIGACVHSHDPGEIASLVTAYVADPARRDKEGARAFARHQKTYNYERVFRRLQDMIESW